MDEGSAKGVYEGLPPNKTGKFMFNRIMFMCNLNPSYLMAPNEIKFEPKMSK